MNDEEYFNFNRPIAEWAQYAASPDGHALRAFAHTLRRLRLI